MTYEEALRYWDQAVLRGSYLGLDRIAGVLDRLGNPEKQLKFVHVAGTNGKGSTAALLESCLRQSGYRVGLYTSPHLVRYHERFRIDGEEIREELLLSATERVKAVMDTLDQAPTQFELLTCIGFCCFAAAGCDLVVLEVGLGGRADTTNVIPVPEAAVITRIGLEHTELLGDTLEEIAAEKAGIIKAGGTVILGDSAPETAAVTQRVCRETGARLVRSDPAEARVLSRSLAGQTFSWRQYPEITLPLLGDHQIQNACTALTTLEVLKAKGWRLPEESVVRGFRSARWPGRFECVSLSPAVILDGGHNPQCAQAIADALRTYFPGRKCTFLMGIMADKQFRGIFDALLPLAERILAVTPDSPRALPAGLLCQRLRDVYGYDAAAPYEAAETALAAALDDAGPETVICVCGSLYLVGDVRRLLSQTRSDILPGGGSAAPED